MPPTKNKARVGRLAQSLRKIKNKPRVEEDEADLIEFSDDEFSESLTDKPRDKQDEDENAQPEVKEATQKTDDDIEIPDPVIVRNQPTDEMLRIAVIENKLRREAKEAKLKGPEPKPKIRATDMAKMIRDAIKEQLAEELKQRDSIKEQRKAEKEARELEKQTIKEKLAEQLREEKRIKDEQLKEEKRKLKALEAKKERELLRQEIESGIKVREEQMKNALNLSIRKARSSVLLS